MARASRFVLALSALSLAAFSAAAQTSPTLPEGSENPPARYRALNIDIQVHSDGSWTETAHVELQLLTGALLNILAQPAIDYSESLQTVEIKSAYTLKPNGTKLDVTPGSVVTRQKATATPFFTDIKQKVLLFPHVEPGDVLVYDWVMQSKPQIPGQFFFSLSLARALEVDTENLTFGTPKEHPIHFELHGVELQKSANGGNLTYAIHYANSTPVTAPLQFLSLYDRGPRVFASTIDSYDTLAAAYEPLVRPTIAVTPKIQAMADEITKGAADRREQARKIYDWVSANIRYVALLFGDGAVVPHDAESVLANGFGDCKDHAALLSALLNAKGIPSELALINGTNGYTAPGVPALRAFNHMIVWLPEFKLYADSTSRTTPFGLLPWQDYGKPVVLVGDGRNALQRTPVPTSSDSTFAASASLKLGDDAKVSGQQTTTATGTVSSALRVFALAADAAGTDKFAKAVLQKRGLSEATGTFAFEQPGQLDSDLKFASSYQTESRPEMYGDKGFPLMGALSLTSLISPLFIGPISQPNLKDADSVPCFSGRASDDFSLEFPADRKLASVPHDVRIDTANLHYESHWSQAGNTVSVHRELNSHFDEPLCTGNSRHETLDAIQKIRNDYETRLIFAAAP